MRRTFGANHFVGTNEMVEIGSGAPWPPFTEYKMPASYKPTKEDRARVQLMAAGGMTQESIAKRMEMTDKTLRQHFRQELDFGLLEVNTLAIGQLVKAIKGGQSWAICFWLKTRAGWRETDRQEHRFVDEQGKDRKLLDLASVRAFMRSVPDAPSE